MAPFRENNRYRIVRQVVTEALSKINTGHLWTEGDKTDKINSNDLYLTNLVSKMTFCTQQLKCICSGWNR